MATINSSKTTYKANIIGESRPHTERVRLARLLWAGPLVALASTLGTIAVREIGVAIGTVPAGLQILQEPAVAISTIAFVLVGALVFALVAWLSKHPARTFSRVALVALALSFVNPIAAGAGWMPVGVPVGVSTVLTMMVMHVVAAIVTIYLLPLLTTEQ